MTTKRTPFHPGEILKEMYVEATENITQKKLAASIGVSFRSINQICNKRRSVTPDMAVRLAKFFNTTPNFWLNLQQQYDLDIAEKNVDTSGIRPLKTA